MTDFEDKKKEYYSQNFNDLKLPGNEYQSLVFEECNFVECNFSEATFSRCKFVDCLFEKCNLSIVKFNQSRFSDVVFDGSKVIGVDWTKVTWPNIALNSPLKFFKCIINDSCFFGLNLKELVIEECKAHDVDFREGNFCEANFSYTDFSNSLFNNTNLTSSDFTESVNYQIDVHLNKIKGARFSRYEAVSLLESLEIELVD